MKPASRFHAFLVVLLLFLANSRAEVPNGAYNLQFGDTAGIWDISGTYYEYFSGIETEYTIYQDADGKLTGFGSFSINISGIYIEGDLCPQCRYALDKVYGGRHEDVKVHRVAFSEKERVGIGTFQPKDEKNQDSTELTGDINYRKIAEFGSDSDPRAFNFDGEFNVANRGIIEFIEVLKLDVAFLYDLLGASQEHKVKPKKCAQTDIDEVISGHTNEPEYRRLQNNEFMEALRDRTVKELPGLNHLFQACRLCTIGEYAQLEETMSPAALEEISNWILARHPVRR